jgi:hypothetical protein
MAASSSEVMAVAEARDVEAQRPADRRWLRRVGVGRTEFGSSGFRDRILGNVTEMAVKMTADKLSAVKSRLQ